MGCFWVFQCVCVNSRVRTFFSYKFNQRKWGKGRETSAEIIQALCPGTLSICVCCMDVCMNSMCVWQLLHVFVTQLARHPVGLGSTVGRSVPFWLRCVCECVSANVCVCVRTCVCWQDLLFVSLSCHRLVTPGRAGILKRDGEPTKCSVSRSSPVSL